MNSSSTAVAAAPYAEEMLDWADEHGIVVIDETAAVGFNLSLGIGFEAGNKPKELYSEEAVNGETQQAHLQAIKELIARDKNHPSVVMWSIANEPDTRPQGAREYFAPLAEATRKLDPTRPITCVNVMFCDAHTDTISDLFDVLCPRGGARYPIRPIVSRITRAHWPSFYNVVTGKTLALPNLIALQHIPLSPAGVIAKRPAPIALPNSCAA